MFPKTLSCLVLNLGGLEFGEGLEPGPDPDPGTDKLLPRSDG